MQPLISLQQVYKERRGDGGFCLHIESLEVARGALVALVGPSGCGKSTALDMIAMALQPDRADAVLFCPHDVPIDIYAYWQEGRSNALAALRRQYIGYVLQTGGLLPFLTGYGNIVLGYHAHEGGKASEEARVASLATALDITHILHKKPAHMSVGERQRVAIARALVARPLLILADEPVASLDPMRATQVMELFVTLAREQGSAVVMVTHAPERAASLGFRLVSTRIERRDTTIFAHMAQASLAARVMGRV